LWLKENSDVIVVGAGAAGIVAATRFAEAGLETLLLERGGPPHCTVMEAAKFQSGL